MRHRIAFVLGLLLVTASTSVEAQKRGTKAPDWDKMGKSGPAAAPQMLSKKDVEEMNPIGRLLDKKKDLKLTEAQVASLKELDTKGSARDASLFEAMDSLRKEMRPSGGNAGGDQRLRLMGAREHFAKAVGDVRANYAADEPLALAALDAAQRPAAMQLLDKQRAEATETVSKKMAPAGGGAGGRGQRPPA